MTQTQQNCLEPTHFSCFHIFHCIPFKSNFRVSTNKKIQNKVKIFQIQNKHILGGSSHKTITITNNDKLMIIYSLCIKNYNVLTCITSTYNILLQSRSTETSKQPLNQCRGKISCMLEPIILPKQIYQLHNHLNHPTQTKRSGRINSFLQTP